MFFIVCTIITILRRFISGEEQKQTKVNKSSNQNEKSYVEKVVIEYPSFQYLEILTQSNDANNNVAFELEQILII